MSGKELKSYKIRSAQTIAKDIQGLINEACNIGYDTYEKVVEELLKHLKKMGLIKERIVFLFECSKNKKGKDRER
ncbi:MAG: hypothetical protein ACKKMS_03460 [Candidatus Nealsonbacteria bacterium]